MALVEWTLDGNCAILTMNSGENRLNLRFLNEMLFALDAIEHNTDASALVVTASDPKIWCNGMDLDWLLPAIKEKDPDVDVFFDTQDRLYRRVTFYPMITVAAITGHAFAGGAILACAFDFRYMRSDRGFLCFPEVDLNIPFIAYMDALIRRTLPMSLVFEAELTGHRFTGAELAACGAIRKSCPSAEETLKDAVAWAKTLNKGRHIVGTMKNTMNADLACLMDNIVRPKLDAAVS
jgi:enoyl-CoA hydratase/carnithine racemase